MTRLGTSRVLRERGSMLPELSRLSELSMLSE
jgi:hypothetical protein